MNIIRIPNFITEEERRLLIEHAHDNTHDEKTVAIPIMEELGSYLDTKDLYDIINKSKHIMCVSVQAQCDILIDIEKRIKIIFEPYINKTSEVGSPFIMVHFKNSELSVHKDPKTNIPGGSSCFMDPTNELIRANILLQKPDAGGIFSVDPTGEGQQIHVEFNERELLIFNAGDFHHQVTPTLGEKSRLITICSIEASPGTMENLKVNKSLNPLYINP